MAEENYDIERELKNWFSEAGKTVVVGIGNPIRTDDFVGVKIVQNLQGKVSRNVLLLECETVPESFIQQIVDFDPTHVLLIDAAILDLKPGEPRLIEPARLMDFPAFSTHMLPLRIFCEYLTKTTSSRIGLLLVEPLSVCFGEGLTSPILAASERLSQILVDTLP